MMADDQVFSIQVFQNKWNVLISGSKSLEPAIELLTTTVFDSSYTFCASVYVAGYQLWIFAHKRAPWILWKNRCSHRLQ